MTRVEILYNFYTSASRISINGQPISAVSALSRFQTLPFRQWYDQLLDVVEREVNDDFSLRLLARPVEGQLLQPLAAACPACRSYQRSGTPLDDPALRRLKHLSQRISTGAVPACPRQKFTVRLYCADPAALLRDAGLAKLLPRLAFCRPELQVLDIKALAPSDADATIVVTDTEPDSPTRVQLARCAPGTACAVHLGGRGTPAAGDIYFCSAPTMADLPGAVGDFLEFGPYVALLHRALDSYVPEQLGIHRAEVAALGAVEPQTVVEPVTLLEVGQTVRLPVQVYPAGSPVPALSIRSSAAGVVAEKDGELTGVDVGKCMVTVLLPGEQRPLAEFQVTVIQRNRITALQLQPASLELEMGSCAAVQLSYQPENADNVSKLRYRSSSGLVAVADDRGRITPRRPGSCDIIADAEGVTARCHVTVVPRLEAFAIDPPSLSLTEGEVARVRFARQPAGAPQRPVRVELSDPSTVAYDFMAGLLEAKHAGSCCIRYTSEDGRVTARLDVTVTATKPKGFLERLFGG